MLMKNHNRRGFYFGNAVPGCICSQHQSPVSEGQVVKKSSAQKLPGWLKIQKSAQPVKDNTAL
jgi:hypothetical protein